MPPYTLMRPLSLLIALVALLLVLVGGRPAAAQPGLTPGDLDHVLGGALALTMQAADALDGVAPASAGDVVTEPDTLRRIQQRALEAAFVAQRAHTYLRLYVMHMSELGGTPPGAWPELLDVLAATSFSVMEVVAVPAEQLDAAPFDAATLRADDVALAVSLRTLAASMGDLPDRYEEVAP